MNYRVGRAWQRIVAVVNRDYTKDGVGSGYIAQQAKCSKVYVHACLRKMVAAGWMESTRVPRSPRGYANVYTRVVGSITPEMAAKVFTVGPDVKERLRKVVRKKPCTSSLDRYREKAGIVEPASPSKGRHGAVGVVSATSREDIARLAKSLRQVASDVRYIKRLLRQVFRYRERSK